MTPIIAISGLRTTPSRGVGLDSLSRKAENSETQNSESPGPLWAAWKVASLSAQIRAYYTLFLTICKVKLLQCLFKEDLFEDLYLSFRQIQSDLESSSNRIQKVQFPRSESLVGTFQLLEHIRYPLSLFGSHACLVGNFPPAASASRIFTCWEKSPFSIHWI